MQLVLDHIPLPTPAATETLGAAIARILRRGDVVALYGGLGMGKTTLARGLIRALAGDVETPSPTYTLVQSYPVGAGGWGLGAGEQAAETPPSPQSPAPSPLREIVHADLYRLESPEEAVEIGLEDAFLSAATVIEWPERLEGGKDGRSRLPGDRLEVHLTESGDDRGGRQARIVVRGAWRERIDELRNAVGGVGAGQDGGGEPGA